MPQFYYAASTGGFYLSDIHRTMPNDAVPISQEHHQHLIDAQADGLQVRPDASGYPIAAPPPPPSAEQMLQNMREERDHRLAGSDYLMMPDYPMSPEQRAAWTDYRQQLRDLPETTTDPAGIIWPVAPTGEKR